MRVVIPKFRVAHFLRIVFVTVIALNTRCLLADTPSLVKQLNDQLANVSEQVSEAVVVISVDKMSWGAGEDMGEMPNDLYRDYGNSRHGAPRRKPPEGQGSG